MRGEAGEGEAGFTLIELVVTVLIIGVLAAVGMSNYFQSTEISKADAASALLVQIVHANHMYALDHGGQFLSGTLQSGCGPCNQAAPTVCNLTACQYLAPQDFSQLPYAFTLSGAGGGSATRISGYKGWGYASDIYGNLTSRGSPPAPLPAKK